MAQAETNPTRSDDAAPKASSNWLLLEDVFQRWRVRLKSSHEAVDELNALLRDRETRSRIQRVDTGGEKISDTVTFLNAQFWQDHGALLSVVPDADGVGDRLGIDYTDAAEIYWPDGHWEFSVRRLDVERHERLYPELAAPLRAVVEQDILARKPCPPTTAALPSTAAAPAVSEVATQDAPRPTAGSREQQLVQEIAATIFPGGYSSIRSSQLYKDVTDEQSRRHLPISKRDVVMRALGRRKG
jgi:hypothetical protein